MREARFRPAQNDESVHQTGLGERRAQDLGNSDVLHIEVLQLPLRVRVATRLEDQGRQKALVAVQLGGDHALKARDDLVLVPEVAHRVGHQRGEQTHALLVGLLVADQDLGWVQAHLQESFGLLQQLPAENQNEVRPVARLGFLHLRRHRQHLRRRVVHLHLLDQRCRVARHVDLLQVRDHDLVHSHRPQRRPRDLRYLHTGLDVPQYRLLQA